MRHTKFLFIFGLLAASTALAPAAAEPAPKNPVDGELRGLAAKAAKLGKRPEGALALLELWTRWDDSTPEATLGLLEKLADDPRLSPSRRVLTRALLAEGRMRLGTPDEVLEGFSDLGFVTEWRVIGPFDNEGKTGFERDLPPEEKRMEAPDMQASYPGRERPVSWRRYPEISKGGYVSFSTIMRPYQNVCGFAETFVKSDSARPLSLWIGSGGANKVYWNGEEVARDDAYRYPSPDRSVVMVGAHAGDNRLLVKVCITDMPWGFHLRLGDERGGPAKGLSYAEQSDKALDIARGHSAVKLPSAPLSALAGLERELNRKEPGARAYANMANYLRWTGSDDPAERKARQYAERAAELEPSVENLALAAALAEERGEVLRFADKLGEVAPDDPSALLVRAHAIADGLVPEDALPLLARVSEKSSQWADARQLEADILEQLGLPAMALSVIEEARAKVGDTPNLLRSAASLRLSAGKPDGSLELRKRLLAQRFDDEGSRRVLIADALQRGETAEVNEHIDALRALSPGGLSTLLYVAHLYEALGRDDLALSSYRQAMSLVPESARAHVAYGKALLRAHQEELAAEAFVEALRLRPQDAPTRELLEQIRPRVRPDEAYAMASDRILESRRDNAKYPSTVLIDLTVNTVFENGLGASFHQFAAQVHDDEGARQFRSYSIQYDPDSQRVDLRLSRVTRKDGRVLESVRTYEQQLGEPWYRIYYDTRALTVVFPDLEPGDTIELRYRIDDIAHRNLFADYYGDLHTFQGYTPTVRAEYVLITPKEREFFVNEPALPGLRHERKVVDGQRIDHYVATDIPAIVAEAGMPGLTETSPYLHVSTYKSWKDVGRWYWGLIKDQLYADRSLKRTVAELIDGAKTTREKVERIHKWVVGHTRYVGLEFGIHGFLPYRVPLIVQRGFGDCKDKASLLYTMFREAGVDARIVLVRTRRNGDIEQRPASLAIFDHAIAYVPELDLYLDGTAEHSGLDELPVQDQGVTVLVVGPHDAELRKTPVFNAESNKRSRELAVELAADGSARVKGSEVVAGAEAAGYRGYYEAPGTRAERFERSLGSLYPGVTLEEQRFESLDDLEQPVRYSYRLRVPQMANRDGEQLHMAPTVLSDLVPSMARLATRRYPLDLDGNRAYVEERTVVLPPGPYAVDLPPGGEARSPFGHLKLAFEKQGREVKARTEFSVTRDRVPPEEYPAFRRWVEEADQLLKQRIGIRRDDK